MSNTVQFYEAARSYLSTLNIRSSLTWGMLTGLIILLTLTACGIAPGSQPTTTEKLPKDTPQFSGPYAADFRDAYQRTQSDKARQILATGVITESNFAEIQAEEKSCLEENGFTDVQHFPTGGMSVTPPAGIHDAEIQDLVKGCSDESGSTEIEALYHSLLINPDNENMDELAVKCLIDNNFVEPSFTVADLDAWYANEDPRLRTGTPEGFCTSDPLGRLNQGN